MTDNHDRLSIALIPLGPKPKVSPQAIKRFLESTWRGLPELGAIEKSNKTTISFCIGEQAVAFLSLMPAPIPWSELEGPCATSVLWPESAEVLRSHKAHLLITIRFNQPTEPIERATLLTQVTTSVVHNCAAALGVYWGNATLVIPPQLFCEFAIQVMPDELPLYIWVDFRIGKNATGKTVGFTSGLEALGLMEIETDNATESPSEVRARFEGLIDYLVHNGLAIKHGDTIGEDMHERIKALHAPSLFGREGTVLRLDYEAPLKKKSWFGYG